MAKFEIDVVNNIAKRAHYLANKMIYMANDRDDVEKGDPKIGGHSSASSSALHILGTIHLIMKTGFDHIANKPHASPADHAYNYLLDLLLKSDLSKLSLEECNQAMRGLRAFPKNGEYVFQSYHSAYDPDFHNFFPSGTVGIPPVNAGYLALAYKYAASHKFEVPQAHFWSIIGDSEFREGSLFEAVPDFADREVGNLTWIMDYNRQSLDGHRITNRAVMNGTDDMRAARTMEANGWHVIQVRHGKKRLALFRKPGGDTLQKLFEGGLDDYDLQVLLQLKDGKAVKDNLKTHDSRLAGFIDSCSDKELLECLHDLGGHDMECLAEAMEASKKETRRPSFVIAHTIKGWGLRMAATPGNHSALPDEAEMAHLAERAGMPSGEQFARFAPTSPEGKFLKTRGEQIYKEILAQHALKEKNKKYFIGQMAEMGAPPETLDINLKMANYPHTQWMLGQLTAKLTRIANTPLNEKELKEKQKALTPTEKAFKTSAEMMVSMAPDVGTSTNLNPAMDGKIFGAAVVDDEETEWGVKDTKTPDLVPGQEIPDRFLRFDIAEANVMSCMGSFGRMRDTVGIPLLPLMTVYDFFVKRALDQFFYNLYWKSSFLLVGTPSGVTLSPEGAQHGWKSDIQIPNQITWEPFYCQELDWILVESIRRHMTYENEGRNGVFIRGVTRGVDQKPFLQFLKTQTRFKVELNGQQLTPAGMTMAGGVDEAGIPALDDATILAAIREDVLKGGYYLIDYRGYAGYEPGDNVVNIFSLGSPTTEAIKASQELLRRGIYANVIVVTCTDLLIGNLAHEDNYSHLRHGLGVSADIYLKPTGGTNEISTLAGRRVPIVSVHDGEIGLLDNIGSIVGVRQETLAVRKHSRCGRPTDIYRYHHIDSDSVIEAVGKVLSETALENMVRSSQKYEPQPAPQNWRALWP